MGFFKSLGQSIKKNVSLKNIVKVATPLMGAIPVVGGYAQSIVTNIQAQNEARKAEEEAKRQQAEAQAEYNRQVEAQAKAEAERQKAQAEADLGNMQRLKSSDSGQPVTVESDSFVETLKKSAVWVVTGLVALIGAVFLFRKPRGRGR